MTMTAQHTNWLSPKRFAERIGTSVDFVHKQLSAGRLPYRYTRDGRSRLVNRCHVRKFRPYPASATLFSTEDIIATTGLSRQTICDLLKKREIRYACSDGCGERLMKVIPLDVARPVKRWVIPERTVAAFEEAVQPNRDGWPTAQAVARQIGSSTSYVLQLFKTGRIRGQQSIIRQRVHIHPADATQLEYDDGYNVPIGSVSTLTGLAVQTISEIVRRGYFTQRYSDGDGRVATAKIPVLARKRLKRYWFSKEGLKALLKGVSPYLMHWPTATAVEKRLDLRPGTVSRYFGKGELRGRTAIKGQGQRLHIHPSELRHFLLQSNYNVDAGAEKLGVTSSTLKRWNMEVAAPFLRHGLGHHAYIPPHILGRMRLLRKHNALSRHNVHMLNGSYAAFEQAFYKQVFNTLYYDPDQPPSIGECRQGMCVIFPDRKTGVIRRTGQNIYRPSIEIFRNDEHKSLLYAVAK